jgi:hypothetical protein
MTIEPLPTRRLLLAASGMVLLPRAACARSAKRRRVATLSAGSSGSSPELWTAFRQELRALGVGDDDIIIESRWADGHGERLPELATELVRLAPDVILTTSSETALAVKQATTTIPIVMAQSGDPLVSVLSLVWRAQVGTSPVCRALPLTFQPSWWSCSRRSLRRRPVLPRCSIGRNRRARAGGMR